MNTSFSVTEVVTAVRCPRQLVLVREGHRVAPHGGDAIGQAAHTALTALAEAAARLTPADPLHQALASAGSGEEEVAAACYALAYRHVHQRAIELAPTVDGEVLEAEVQREEIAVYTRLTALLADVLPSVEACVDAMALAEVRAAVGRLAVDLRLQFPVVVDEPVIDLTKARHPLLLLDLPDVVPSDLAIRAGRAMVISGPNAGGKTVALKTMGLAALMVRAGLPCAAWKTSSTVTRSWISCAGS